MSKFSTKKPVFVPVSKIFKVFVLENKNEIAAVFLSQIQQKEKTRFQMGKKKFKNEMSKIRFLSNLQKSGFKNFKNISKKITSGNAILECLSEIEKSRKNKN